MLRIRVLLRSLFQFLLFVAALLIPAGTWHWPRAIHFLTVYGVLSVISTTALAYRAPASLEARVQRGVAKDQPPADKIATFVLAIVARIVIEEKNLRENLPGYIEYKTQVPYRLISPVW